MLINLRAKSQAGFTMLEVLVSIVVLALGLLGLASLLGASISGSHSASLRTQATVLAYGIVDAMRANRCNAKDGAYDISMSGNASGSPMTVAQRDMGDWLTELSRRLPSGDGQIRRSAGCGDGDPLVTPTGCDGSPTPIAVVVQWNDARVVGGSSSQRFCVVTQL